MTQNPWTNIRRSLLIPWWTSVEDFNVLIHVSYNENEGPDFPAWQTIWCSVLAGRCQLRREVGGDTALREGLRWVVRPDRKGWMATSTSATWKVARHNVPLRSPVSVHLFRLEVLLLYHNTENFSTSLTFLPYYPRLPSLSQADSLRNLLFTKSSWGFEITTWLKPRERPLYILVIW